MRKLLLEGLLVAVVGAALAFVANAVSPRGLRLARNYFPAELQPSSTSHGANGAAAAGSPVEAMAREAGVSLADSNRVAALFADPRREQNLVVFVDARDTGHYQAGHIPGAYQLDYYHKEEYLPTVLPVCMAAQDVVVYCNGGTCEDSLLTAKVLLAPVVAKEKLFVYAGGFTEWTNNRMPVELGSRGSGRLAEASK